MKYLKYSALALLVLVLGVAVYVATLDLNDYKTRIISEVERATGREFRIDGELGFALSLVPTFAVEGVTLGNADWARSPHLARVGRFEAQVALIPLLSRDVEIRRLLLEDTEIFLEQGPAGQGNWVLEPAGGSAPPPQTGPAPLPRVSVHELAIRDATLYYLDAASGAATVLALEELDARSADPAAPLELRLAASYNELPVTLEGRFGSLEALTAGDAFPVDIQAHIGGAPPLSTLSPVALTGTVKVEPDGSRFSISGLRLQAAATVLDGDLALTLAGDRPALAGALTAPLLDLRPFMPAEEPEKQAKLFSAEPLPLEGLSAVDADIALSIAELRTPNQAFQQVSVPLKLHGGRLSLNPVLARSAGGEIRADLNLDAGAARPALKLDFAVTGLELGRLPRIREKSGLQGAPTDIRVNIAGTGTSIAAIMAGSNGSLLVKVGPGRIPNGKVDLAGADVLLEVFGRLNPLSAQEPVSELQCAVVNFRIRDGMATTDKGIAVQTAKMTLVGSGTVNLKDETLDLGIRPHARAGTGLGLGSIAGAARIGGTLAQPKAVVDAANVLRTGVSAGAAVATFGLSALAQGMFDRQTADPAPCDTALGKAPAPRAADREAPAEPADEGITDKVKGVFKGLFGD